VRWKGRVNALLSRTTGYQLSRPPADRAWRPPQPERVNALLSRTVGYQLSRPRAGPARHLPPPRSGRLLVAPVFIFSAARSGSTLLRAVLGSHSQLYAPPELPLAHLGVRAETRWIETSLDELKLTTEDLDYMLWDRVLADALERSGKPTIVVKTPSNVLIWQRIAACWPDSRFIFLLRHPAASVVSLQASWSPAWHSNESGSLEESVSKGLRYMGQLEEARNALPGLTVRYEDLTAHPEAAGRQLCGFLGLPFEPAMLDYGQFAHPGFAAGLGDSSASIRSGRIQPPAPLPSEIPPELKDICAAWGYLEASGEPLSAD
jgi:hypothetical protein